VRQLSLFHSHSAPAPAIGCGRQPKPTQLQERLGRDVVVVVDDYGADRGRYIVPSSTVSDLIWADRGGSDERYLRMAKALLLRYLQLPHYRLRHISGPLDEAISL
jgi:hypothetical protein